MMYTYKCKKCNREIGLDKTGHFLECKGCGDRITDPLMVDIAEFDESMTCPHCGATMRRNESGELLICDYCGTTCILEQYFEIISSKYDNIVTFKDASDEAVRERFFRIAEREFAPADFRHAVKIKEIKNVFLPFYLFEVYCDVSYTLEVGTERTRQVWDDTNKKYKDEKYTEWNPASGNFSDTFYVCTRGFLYENVKFENGNPLGNKAILKEFHKYVKNHTSKLIDDDRQPYSPILLDKHDVVEKMSETSSFTAEGRSQLKSRIEARINSLYSQFTRNIRFTNTEDIESVTCDIIPVSMINYDYKNYVDQLLMIDGNKGEYYRGTVPVSALGKFIKMFKWLGPIALIIGSIVIINSPRFYDSDMKPPFVVLSIITGIAIFRWMSLLKGTGGDKNSEQAKNNKKNNSFYGILTAFLLGIMAAVGMSGMKEPQKEQKSTKQESVKNDSTAKKKEQKQTESATEKQADSDTADDSRNEAENNMKKSSENTAVARNFFNSLIGDNEHISIDDPDNFGSINIDREQAGGGYTYSVSGRGFDFIYDTDCIGFDNGTYYFLSETEYSTFYYKIIDCEYYYKVTYGQSLTDCNEECGKIDKASLRESLDSKKPAVLNELTKDNIDSIPTVNFSNVYFDMSLSSLFDDYMLMDFGPPQFFSFFYPADENCIEYESRGGEHSGEVFGAVGDEIVYSGINYGLKYTVKDFMQTMNSRYDGIDPMTVHFTHLDVPIIALIWKINNGYQAILVDSFDDSQSYTEQKFTYIMFVKDLRYLRFLPFTRE